MSDSKTAQAPKGANIAASASHFQLAGGWGAYSADISSEAQTAFNKAFEGFLGVTYTPLAVASQVVSGMNYSFFCNALGVYPGAQPGGAMVQIYADLNGNATIQNITATGR